MAAETSNNPEKQDEPYNPGELQAAERFPDELSPHGTDRARSSASGSKDTDGNTKNIDDAQSRENAGGWKDNYTGGKKKVTGKAFFKRKGPMGFIITLVLGGGLGIGGLLSPAGALIHIKEIITQKFDSISPVVDERSVHILKSRMFSTNLTCKVKVKCRFTGVNEKQMQAIKDAKGKLVDANGKEVTKNSLGRYTGGKTLILPDGTKVGAKDWTTANKIKNPAIREFTVKMFAAKRMSFNGKAMEAIRSKFKLTKNPAWGDGSDNDAKKSLAQATTGESISAQATNVPDSEKYETEKDDKGNVKMKDGEPVFKMKDGEKIPINDGSGGTVDLGDAAKNINEEADKIKDGIAGGVSPDDLPSDPGGAATLPETPVASKGILGSALGFLNPADILVGMCTTYKFANTMIMAARIVALANAMRYAAQFLATADKIKAGDATANDVAQPMNILEREDPYGDGFGDAVGYQYPAYNTIPDKSIASSAIGNGVIVVMSQIVSWLNHHFSKKVLKDGCGILSSPITQIGLSLTSFIPGGGAAFKGITKAFSAGIKIAADKAIKKTVADIVSKTVKKGVEKAADKAALKTAARAGSKEFAKMAGSALGIFLGGYLTQRYMVPWLARVLAGADIANNGVSGMDSIANGLDATIGAGAQEEGLQALTKEQDTAFSQFKNSSDNAYVASMRAQSNPFDVLDPYSASNSLAASFYTAASKVKSSSILSAPAAILSAINPANLLSANAHADTTYTCEDDYLNDQDLATSPFCNVKYGYADTNMLENTEPEAVTDYMLNNNQIDENGDAVEKSDYADFVEKCGPGSGGKTITDFDAEGQNLDKECYSDKNNTTEWKYFRLYEIDANTSDDMDEVPATDASSNIKYIAVGNIPIEGKDVGASVFGGKQVGGGSWAANWADNQGNDLGNHDNHLTGTSSFAELDMGKALGNIPNGTKLEIRYPQSSKTIIASKEDIGAGGDDVDGHKRAIDLWWQTANALGFNVGTGVVSIHAVDPNTPLTPVATNGNSSKNIASVFNFNLFSPFVTGVKQ